MEIKSHSNHKVFNTQYTFSWKTSAKTHFSSSIVVPLGNHSQMLFLRVTLRALEHKGCVVEQPLFSVGSQGAFVCQTTLGSGDLQMTPVSVSFVAWSSQPQVLHSCVSLLQSLLDLRKYYLILAIGGSCINVNEHWILKMKSCAE